MHHRRLVGGVEDTEAEEHEKEIEVPTLVSEDALSGEDDVMASWGGLAGEEGGWRELSGDEGRGVDEGP